MRILKEYFCSEDILILDCAFLGLYGLFSNFRKKSRKKKILFTATTCPSSVFAAVYAGFDVDFVDISMKNFLMDTDLTIKKLNEDNEIAAIVYAYSYGHTSEDILRVKKIARNKNIILVEDCTQAFDAKINGELVGKIGDYSVFSFGYSKYFDSDGGGFIIKNYGEIDLEEIEFEISICERYDINEEFLSNYRKSFNWLREKSIIYNDKYTEYFNFIEKYRALYFKNIELDIIALEEKISDYIKIDMTKERMCIANKYHKKLIKIAKSGKIIVPEINSDYSIYRYTFVIKDQEKAKRCSSLLRESGINCSNLYIPVGRFFFDKGYGNSVKLAEGVINLWVDDTISDEHIDKTVEIIKSVL